jgi:membrane protein involved in colicin uptake
MNIKDLMARMRGSKEETFEDEVYQLVWDEIQQGRMDPVAQARSIEDGRGDDGLVKSAYIKHRLRRLKHEIEQRSQEELKERQRRRDVEAQRVAEETRIQRAADEAQRKEAEAARRSPQKMAEERRTQRRKAEAEATRIAEEVLLRKKHGFGPK